MIGEVCFDCTPPRDYVRIDFDKKHTVVGHGSSLRCRFATDVGCIVCITDSEP
jgi:hypothetical protein